MAKSTTKTSSPKARAAAHGPKQKTAAPKWFELEKQARDAWKHKQYAEAEDLFKKAVLSIKAVFVEGTDPYMGGEEVSRMLIYLGDFYCDRHEFPAAMRVYDKAAKLVLLAPSLTGDGAEDVATLDVIAGAYQGLGCYDKAAETYELALGLLRRFDRTAELEAEHATCSEIDEHTEDIARRRKELFKELGKCKKSHQQRLEDLDTLLESL